MVWIEQLARDYELILTDGYFEARGEAARMALERDLPPEQAAAEWLYSRAKLNHLPTFQRQARIEAGYVVPDPTHIWMVGAPGWLGGKSRIALALAEGDRHPGYRVVIAGLGDWTASPQSVQEWERRLGAIGFSIKPHPVLMPYLLVGSLLLGEMQEYYAGTGKPPTTLLTELGMPVAFRGDGY